MRDLKTIKAARLRAADGDLWKAFVVKSPIDHEPMIAFASTNDGWDHVSVSRARRMPNWI